jgi:protein tyrosine phosphatase
LIRRWDRAKIFRRVFVCCFPWSSVETLLLGDDVRSGRTTDTTIIPAEKVHKFWSDCWIAPKFLEEFQLAVFLGVARKLYSSATMSVGSYHQHDQSTGWKRPWLLIRPLDRAQIFRGVFVSCFPWSSMESLLHADDIRSGRTTDATTVQAKKVHKFWSERWITLKVLEDFP